MCSSLYSKIFVTTVLKYFYIFSYTFLNKKIIWQQVVSFTQIQ